MSKWSVSVEWFIEVEAEDEGGALCEADRQFSFMREAQADNLDEESESNIAPTGHDSNSNRYEDDED